jgi:hypothetical protein
MDNVDQPSVSPMEIIMYCFWGKRGLIRHVTAMFCYLQHRACKHWTYDSHHAALHHNKNFQLLIQQHYARIPELCDDILLANHLRTNSS